MTKGIRVVRAELPLFLSLTFLCMVPGLVLDYAEVFGSRSAVDDHDRLVNIGLSFLSFWLWRFLQFIADAALCSATIRHLSKGRVSFEKKPRLDSSRLFTAIVVSFVASLLVSLGFLFLLVPSFILGCMFYVVGPVAIAEPRGPWSALGRSISLTNGSRLPLFIASAILATTLTLPSLGISYLAASHDLQHPSFLALTVLGIIFGSVRGACAGVAYVLLRERKEGVSGANLARIFA